MRTRSSSNLPVKSSPNPTTSNPKRHNRRRSKQPFILEESLVDTIADQRTMAELLRAPTEGYAEEIVVPLLLAEKFKLKHGLINMMTLDHDANSSSSEIAKLTHSVNQQTSVVTTAMTAILKQFQATPPPAFVKSIEEIYLICSGAHPYYQCLAAGGNTFSELRDNIQGYVAAAAEDECVEETLTDQDLVEYNIKVPPPLLHINITLAEALILIPKYHKMLKALLSNKEKLLELANTPLNKNCSAVILKKLPEKLRDPGKFLILCGFRELKCKSLADLESINMINIYDDSSEDFLENLFATNYQSGNPTFSSHPNLTSPEVKDDVFDPEGGNVLIETFLNLDSTKDLHPLHYINQLSGSTTSSSLNHLLEEFADILAHITFPPGNDDLHFDIESDLKEIEYLLNNDPIKEMNSILKDSIDQSKLADLNDNLVDTMPEMFTKEHALDYSSPSLYDEYDDDLFEVESDTKYFYDDPFNSKGEKIKESKLLIDELDLPSDFLLSSKYDSFLFEDFSKVDDLPSTNNEEKVFNSGILIQENLFEVITRVALD
uniref:Reverse transcriptase domain-containing protein n=1 Tax=Tanacetum cinerariifolium TaxID=118510 RepID=A0A6L2KAT5_TANCI|nr:reverse transcriptase domain-containing protein [Tanacetum cinerariifolium]